jgi:hypothetical protein
VGLFRRIDAAPARQRRSNRAPRRLSVDGEKCRPRGNVTTLSLTEFGSHALARNPGHVKNRQQLMDAANVVLDDNTITSPSNACAENSSKSIRLMPSKPCTEWATAGSSEHPLHC